MTEPSDDQATEDTAIYGEFDEFLKSAIYEYYQSGGKNRKGSFIALLMASGEIPSLAINAFRSKSNIKRLAVGAASVVALRIGLKYALSGPLGILLAAGTGVSLIAYFVRNRKEVLDKIGRYRELVAQVRVDYEKLQSDHRDGRLTEDQRNLMVDGLMKRFLADLER
ncbi:MAG: hypothetical protein JRH20_16705 [Deltaproteobacteria bacterium]|nr:hypothetical protein [Deltaproteobacteria bacterium]